MALNGNLFAYNQLIHLNFLIVNEVLGSVESLIKSDSKIHLTNSLGNWNSLKIKIE
jgi:hypothetical protein